MRKFKKRVIYVSGDYSQVCDQTDDLFILMISNIISILKFDYNKFYVINTKGAFNCNGRRSFYYEKI